MLKNVEEEFTKFEVEERKSYEGRYENEIKYNKIEKELEDLKMELSSVKKHSKTFSNNDLKLSDKLGRTIFLEKTAGNLNNLSSSNTGNNINNNKNTNIERIERNDRADRFAVNYTRDKENREKDRERSMERERERENNSRTFDRMNDNNDKKEEDSYMKFKISGNNNINNNERNKRIANFDFKR